MHCQQTSCIVANMYVCGDVCCDIVVMCYDHVVVCCDHVVVLLQLMALVLIQLCRLRAIVASCVLFIYWLLQSIAALILLVKVSYDYGQLVRCFIYS